MQMHFVKHPAVFTMQDFAKQEEIILLGISEFTEPS